MPSVDAQHLHVFFELGDHLGSTSVVLDKATSELVEKSTYEAYGSTESDYRPERWKGFREDYRFTSKETDIEVGLAYFGRRFYAPMLQRWVSADPLAVHAAGEADLNLYAYVSGMALKAVDPLGLCGDDGSGGCSGDNSKTYGDRGSSSNGAQGAPSSEGQRTADPVAEANKTGDVVISAAAAMVCGGSGGLACGVAAGLAVSSDQPLPKSELKGTEWQSTMATSAGRWARYRGRDSRCRQGCAQGHQASQSET